MPAEVDGGPRRGRNDFAQANHRLAIGGKRVTGGVRAFRIQHGDHADAAIERAQHFRSR